MLSYRKCAKAVAISCYSVSYEVIIHTIFFFSFFHWHLLRTPLLKHYTSQFSVVLFGQLLWSFQNCMFPYRKMPPLWYLLWIFVKASPFYLESNHTPFIFTQLQLEKPPLWRSIIFYTSLNHFYVFSIHKSGLQITASVMSKWWLWANLGL